MKLRHVALGAALALAAPLPVWAGACTDLMPKVEAGIAANQALDKETLDEIDALHKDAQKQCEAGKEDKAMEALNQAMLLLGLL